MEKNFKKPKRAKKSQKKPNILLFGRDYHLSNKSKLSVDIWRGIFLERYLSVFPEFERLTLKPIAFLIWRPKRAKKAKFGPFLFFP